ncbi:MAG TPA: hypothetical protein VH573_15470 [Mycobacteriales bacterium]
MTVALSLALPVAACGGGADGSTELPPGPAAASAPLATPSATAAGDPVLASYLRFWSAVIAANRAADPSLASLRTAAADPELSRVRATVSRNKVQKLSLRGDVGHTPQQATVRGATATIEDCYDISGWNPVRLDTGQPIEATDESGTGRYRARYTLRRSATGWLVVNHTALGSC